MSDLDLEDKLPPDISEYLDGNDNSISVNIKGNEELIAKVMANTGLNYDSVKIIIESYFQEIRNEMLKGNAVLLQNMGKIGISGPNSHIKKTKKRIFVKFKPCKNLIRKLNGR